MPDYEALRAGLAIERGRCEHADRALFAAMLGDLADRDDRIARARAALERVRNAVEWHALPPYVRTHLALALADLTAGAPPPVPAGASDAIDRAIVGPTLHPNDRVTIGAGYLLPGDPDGDTEAAWRAALDAADEEHAAAEAACGIDPGEMAVS